MTALDADKPRFALVTTRIALPVYAATLFLSAGLLFGVQPMFTKMVLPVLGGTPAVWSVAMVVFQGLLLAGYLYAHLMVRHLGLRRAAIIHLTVAAIAFATLPIAIAPGWGRPPAEGEATWLVGLFVVSVGLPFFALAGNGPLLQAWFARTGSERAADPYFLYGASNAGSFIALLAYPLVVEPLLPLAAQGRLWGTGFALLAGLIAVCALIAIRGTGTVLDTAPTAVGPAPTARQRLSWIAMSAVPSGLLVAVTAHVSTDVAAVPLLWVVPLALFLLTFVLAFRPVMPVPGPLLDRLQAWGTGAALTGVAFPAQMLSFGLTVHLGLFFVNALLVHRALYDRRPASGHLTEFYLCLSAGGVVGGLFAGLLAPQIFSTVLEYPILLAAALLCRPDLLRLDGASARRQALEAIGVGALAALLAGAASVLGVLPAKASPGLLAMVVLITAAMLSWTSPLRLILLALAAYPVAAFCNPATGESHRSFFGVHRLSETADGRFRLLHHGTTVHGAARIRMDDGTPFTGRPEPTTYYAAGGAIADTVAVARMLMPHPSVAMVGLGAGSMACHAAPGERWQAFEIDPEVVRIARTRFPFLAACAPDMPVTIGDARLTLADSADRVDLLLVDAFSSDAIPLHLLTREALGLYAARLSPQGILALHISNRHVDLAPALARLAADQGFVALVRSDAPKEAYESRLVVPAAVAILTRDKAAAAAARQHGWTDLVPDMRRTPWSDDYANIIEAMRDRYAH
jgi:hypothetical protein